MHKSLTIALLQARETAMAYFRPVLKKYDLTEQQWRVIRVVAESGSMDFHDLSGATCILRPSLTGILARMERDGLIIRLKPLTDQRKLYISLTAQGMALYQNARTEIEVRYQTIENDFSVEKLEQLTSLLMEFIAISNTTVCPLPDEEGAE